MKKILMVCNYFAPDNVIAAVRITKIAKYLNQRGYEVSVIAEQRQNIEDEILGRDAEGIKVIRVNNSAGVLKFIAFYQKIIAPIKSKKYDNLDNRVKINPGTGKNEFYPFQTAYPFIGSLDYLMETIRQYDLFWSSKKYLSEYLNVDYVFTSYGSFLGLFAGAHMHKKHIPWIFDIRDSICQYKFTPRYVRWIALLFERYIWKRADCITAVSKGICRRVPRKYWNKVHCVTNGYDKKDREGISIDDKARNKLRFSYTGAMYGGLRNLSPLFKNIRELIDKNEIDEDRIEFCFAGSESAFQIFNSQAQNYRLDKNVVYYGKVTRTESLRLQMESDILLVSSFDYQEETGGIITGKVLEYMSADKPILAIINGDIENSELKGIIYKAKLGFAYEESHEKEDEEELSIRLLMWYKEFMENGRISHNPDRQELKRFDYRYLGNKMRKIIENTH
ncbi:MAG: glycosyltransferase family 4 protein [Hungatella sp.]|nr:glycosyltransferase family 4 protein [Hungatella sp.]